MSADCIFCRIVAGEIPSRTVYEGDGVRAFLDANPLSAGHTLVIPDDHYERLRDVPGDVAADLFATLHEVAPAVEAAVDADALTVAFNDGSAAGQEVPHVHGHIVPRFEDDGGHPIHAVVESRPDLSEADLDGIAADIDERL